MLISNVWSWKGYSFGAPYSVDIAIVRGAIAPKESLDGVPDAFLQIPGALEVGALAFRRPNGRPEFLVRDPDSPYGTRLHAVAGILYENINDEDADPLDFEKACGSPGTFLHVLHSCTVAECLRVWEVYEEGDVRHMMLRRWKDQGAGYLKKARRRPMTEVQQKIASLALKTNEYHRQVRVIDDSHLMFAIRNGYLDTFVHDGFQGSVCTVVFEALCAGYECAIDYFRAFLHSILHEDRLGECLEVIRDLTDAQDDELPAKARAALTSIMKEILLLPMWSLQLVVSDPDMEKVLARVENAGLSLAWTTIKNELQGAGKKVVCGHEKPVVALVPGYETFSQRKFVARAVVLPEPDPEQRCGLDSPVGSLVTVPWGAFPVEQIVTLLTHDPVLTPTAFAGINRAMGEKARLASCTPGFFKTCAMRTLPTVANLFMKRMEYLRGSREYMEITCHPQGSIDVAENWLWRKVFVRLLNEAFASFVNFDNREISARQKELANAICSGKVITSSCAFFDEPWVFEDPDPSQHPDWMPSSTSEWVSVMPRVKFANCSVRSVAEKLSVQRELLENLPNTAGALLQAQIRHDSAEYTCATVRRPYFCSKGGNGTIVPNFSTVYSGPFTSSYNLCATLARRITLDWQYVDEEEDLDIWLDGPAFVLIDFTKHMFPATPWGM